MSETYATECECSEEYGPCEDHSEVLARREGASTRTADELLAVFIGDAIDIMAEEEDPVAGALIGTWSAVADAYWKACPNGGWAPIAEGDAYTMGEELADTATTIESYLPASVWWDDGYVISRITGGPLHPDWAECVWCGRVARCSDAGTGDAMCEDCWHRMDWIIPDGPLLEEDGDR